MSVSHIRGDWALGFNLSLGLHFIRISTRRSRVIAFGRLNIYRGNLFQVYEEVSREVERRYRSFVRLAIRSRDEFYWNFTDDRKKSIYRTVLNFTWVGRGMGENGNVTIARMTVRELCAVPVNRLLSLCTERIVTTNRLKLSNKLNELRDENLTQFLVTNISILR